MNVLHLQVESKPSPFIMHQVRTAFLFIIGALGFVGLYIVSGTYAQYIVDLKHFGSISYSLVGAGFMVSSPIIAHLAIVGNKKPEKEYELHSNETLLVPGVFLFVLTFAITFLVHSDFLVSYYRVMAALLAIWTFFVIAQIASKCNKRDKL